MTAGRLFFVARRWFSGTKGSSDGLRAGFAAAGLAAGVAALVVVLGVMNGLQGGYIDSILEVSSFHVRIQGRAGNPVMDPGDTAGLASSLASLPGVRSALPFSESHAIATGPSGRTIVLSIKFVPPDARDLDPGLAKALGLAEGEPIARKGGITLGSEAAAMLGLSRGGSVRLTGFTSSEDEGLGALNREVPFVAAFKSGYYEFDSGFAYMLESDPVFPAAGARQGVVGVKLEDRFSDRKAMPAIRRLLDSGGARWNGLSARSWRDYNRSFFGALRTEKLVMSLLIGLIFAVVGINIAHSMKRAVAFRMRELATLRAVGMGRDGIRDIFLIEGFVIGSLGALLGLLLGLSIALNVNAILGIAASASAWIAGIPRALGLQGAGAEGIFIPSYYLDRIPVRIDALELALIAAASLTAATLASGGAAAKAVAQTPSEVLRNE